MDSVTACEAINTKYISSGGAEGFLGTAVTQLLQDPGTNGFHIDYEGGSIYWSPTTGAHTISGDIRTRWLAAGGPQGWAYPITDQATTEDDICRFSEFLEPRFGAAIYSTKDHGAHFIYGVIYVKWRSLGAERSPVGYPITDEAWTSDCACRFNLFSKGAMYWTSVTGANMIYGQIYEKWTAAGAEHSPVGFPITDEASTPDEVCRFNNFSRGAIYWNPSTGAHMIYGAIYQKWLSLGAEKSFLGYPLTDEVGTGDFSGRFTDFQGGTIYWSPATGVHVHEGTLPSQLNFNVDLIFSDGTAVRGSADITIFSDGNVEFGGRVNNQAIFVGYNYTVACVIVDADNQCFGLGRVGNISGLVGTLLSSGSREDCWTETVSKDDVAQAWRALVASAVVHSKSRTGIVVSSLINQMMTEIGISARRAIIVDSGATE